MGFLDRLTGGDQNPEREAEREASIAALEAGGLPLNAQRRLQELAADENALFTSNMTVNGFVLSHKLGLDPVCQVMGSSIYKMGWQSRGWSTGQLNTQTAALNNARALALGRLQQEAQLAGAHAVVDVTITRGEHDFVSDSVEFIAIGTAVRVPDAPPGPPVLTDLSLGDYTKLVLSGYDPVGVVAASTVYYIVASWATRRAQGGGWFSGWNNQELTDFTQGVYTARELALSNLQRQAESLVCDGVVGVNIEQHLRTVKVGSESNEREDLLITFHIIGTAIRGSGGPPLPIRPTINQAHPPGAR
ncbi:MAG: hypothetical protein QOF76_1136 [Solirubrobacteraceae bacterium]|nr:hypothetical protein [Solirubrobacteraceae bacterium]